MLLQGINTESHERELSQRPDLTPALLSGNTRAAGSRIFSAFSRGALQSSSGASRGMNRPSAQLQEFSA